MYNGHITVHVHVYRNATSYTVPFDNTRQIRLIKHSFKKHAVKCEIKSQRILQVM